ncbi:MAG: HD domain-containing protein [Oscillospiraceae bacterium]|nr:HD domain-containing protein [Oscillospiraceae bacterium]
MEQKNDVKPKKKTVNKNIVAVCMCLAGIAVNLLCSAAAGKLGLPLYLDTVGTVCAAVMGGPLPAVIVGFFTNIFKSFTDSSALYYGVLNVLIAVAASYLARRGELDFRHPMKLLNAAVVFTLIGGGIGTLIPWFLEGVTLDSASLAATLYDMGVRNEACAQMLSGLLSDFLDKAVTVLLVALIVLVLPQRVRKYVEFSGWMQTPLSREESEAAKKTGSRVMSMRTKILIVLSVALVAVSVGATGISMMMYKKALIRDQKQMVQGVARVAASAVNASKVNSYLAGDYDTEDYSATKDILYSLRNSSPDVEYVYVYRIKEDGCHVVFDLDTPDTPASEVGEVIPFDESFLPYIPKLLKGREIEPIESNDRYGWLLSAYAPVYDVRGVCQCYAAADVSMNHLAEMQRSFFAELLSLFLGVFILIFVFVRWLIEYHIILPVNSIAMSTGAFAYDSEKARENSIERIRELKIHTGDEVENLYHAIAKTSDDSMRYVADVQEKTEQISQMQKALIMVLADIVESRDKNTGAHVRKTAAYTEIILHALRKKGYYTEQLNDDYISDVVNSAPLHDIGKIQVPDAILNKPGRLDDAEYEIMKTHTTAGHDIISQAIALVPNSGYLNEAQNLAWYHHEKWDGSGYPNGISGEEIPLSARVMAVADVFDALVSKRSYKPPMSFEKAMGIIREGAGKHFDPQVVEAFASEEKKVRRVEQKFSEMTNDAGCFK